MNAISDFRTVATPRPKLPPAPRRAMPAAASLEATLAAMQAEAKTWRKRAAKAWGEDMAVDKTPMPSRKIHQWTPEEDAALLDTVLATLGNCGPMTITEMLAAIPAARNRHKLREVMTKLNKAGKVAPPSGKRYSWALV